MRGPLHTLRRVGDEARTMSPSRAAKELISCFSRNEILTYASAVSFQIVFALIPLCLFALGLLGGVGLEDVWSREAAPELSKSMSPPAFAVVDDTVHQVLDRRQLFWMTLGAVITVWAMSGAVRAIMSALDRIYAVERRRSQRQRYRDSVLLAIVTGVLLLLAVAVVVLLPRLVGGWVPAILRWPLAVVLLTAVVTLFLRFAPAERHPSEWVTFGCVVTVVAWLGTSLAFGLYVTHVADYGSIFGALATVIVLFEYLYLASIAFLAGVQLDALVRAQAAERPRSERGRVAVAG